MKINLTSVYPAKPAKIGFKSQEQENSKDVKGEKGELLKVVDKKNLISIENISDKKVGSKFLITFNDPKYKGLTILFKPESKLSDSNGSLKLNLSKEDIAFTGKIYGSIRKNEDSTIDTKMVNAYKSFWLTGMHDKVQSEYCDKNLTSRIKDDYNFFIPSDGDGTRYKDITKLQGGITKPASYLPSTLNGQQMSLVQSVLTNFAKTGKLTEGVDFINVKPAQGSAYAFLEGLADGTISTDKPLVFSWGDNFSDIDVSKLILEHEKKKSGITVLSILTDSERIKSLGAIEVDNLDNLNINWFKEKPTDEAEIDRVKIPEFDNKCLTSVGPYVLSPEALKMIKEKYIQNPSSFNSPDGKGFDFSKMILTPFVDICNNDELLDGEGNPLKMRVKIIENNETWSDLGSEKDFSDAMISIAKGSYSGLPEEIKTSITNNVDKDNNIFFDKDAKVMLEELKSEYGLDIKNTICYFKK